MIQHGKNALAAAAAGLTSRFRIPHGMSKGRSQCSPRMKA